MQVSDTLLIAGAKSRMTFAFMLFREEGINALVQQYPDQYDFVLAHKDKTLPQIRVIIENILASKFSLKRVG